MKKIFVFSLLAAALMFVSCGQKQEAAAPAEEVDVVASAENDAVVSEEAVEEVAEDDAEEAAE